MSPVSVSSSNLKDFVGHPPFISDRLYETTPPGVVMGLAWTSMGGTTLYVETGVAEGRGLSKEGKGEGAMTTTGQLGDVMKESTIIAYTFAKVEREGEGGRGRERGGEGERGRERERGGERERERESENLRHYL